MKRPDRRATKRPDRRFGLVPVLAAALMAAFTQPVSALGADDPVTPAAAPTADPARSATTSIAGQYAQAEQAFRAGDFAEAEKLYAQILDTHGDEPVAWFRIGLIQQRRQVFKAALNAYDNALACAAGDTTEVVAQVLAKVRFNRAILLLESAAKDLQGIPSGTLEQTLDDVRAGLTTQVDAALRLADSEVAVAPAAPATRALAREQAAAKGFVYEIKQPVVSVGPLEEVAQ
jgi:predicted Zn-dependent protease